jgi:hypothetical protein
VQGSVFVDNSIFLDFADLFVHPRDI